MTNFEIDRDPRQKWDWNVRINGKPIARCGSKEDAERIATALRLYEEHVKTQVGFATLRAKLRRLWEEAERE